MAFQARTCVNVQRGELGKGQIVVIDGVTFGPMIKIYEGNREHGDERLVDGRGRPFGAPSAAMLSNDSLIVRTLSGQPWPGSSEDRHGKGKGSNAMANALAGGSSPFGQWPDTRERLAQGNRRFARENPKEYAERVMAQRPYRPEERAQIMGKAAALASGMDPDRFATDGMDVESLPPVGEQATPELAGGEQATTEPAGGEQATTEPAGGEQATIPDDSSSSSSSSSSRARRRAG